MNEEPGIPSRAIPRNVLLPQRGLGGERQAIRADAQRWITNGCILPQGETPKSIDAHVVGFHLQAGTLLNVGIFLDEIAKATFNGFTLPSAGNEIMRQLELTDLELGKIFDSKSSTKHYRQYANYRLLLYVALRIMIENEVFPADVSAKMEKYEGIYGLDQYTYQGLGHLTQEDYRIYTEGEFVKNRPLRLPGGWSW